MVKQYPKNRVVREDEEYLIKLKAEKRPKDHLLIMSHKIINLPRRNK